MSEMTDADREMIDLREKVAAEIAQAFGVPPCLFRKGGSGSGLSITNPLRGTGRRVIIEPWRKAI